MTEQAREVIREGMTAEDAEDRGTSVSEAAEFIATIGDTETREQVTNPREEDSEETIHAPELQGPPESEDVGSTYTPQEAVQQASEYQSRVPTGETPEATISAAYEVLQRDASAFTNWTQSIDWAGLRQTNPNQFLVLKDQHDQHLAALQQRNQLIQGAWQQAQQAKEQQRVDDLNKASAQLSRVIPGWWHAGTRERESQQIIDWMREQGFSEDDIGAVNRTPDIRIVRSLWKSMKFDRGWSQGPGPKGKLGRMPLKIARKRATDWRSIAEKRIEQQRISKSGIQAAAVKIEEIMKAGRG